MYDPSPEQRARCKTCIYWQRETDSHFAFCHTLDILGRSNGIRENGGGLCREYNPDTAHHRLVLTKGLGGPSYTMATFDDDGTMLDDGRVFVRRKHHRRKGKHEDSTAAQDHP